METQHYTASGLARAAGCSRKALQVYQAHGLLPRWDGAGPPSYDEDAFIQLRLIVSLRKAGLSLSQIRAFLGRRQGQPDGAPCAHHMLSEVDELVRQVSADIEQMSRVRAELLQTRELLASCGGCKKSVDACYQCADTGKLTTLTSAMMLSHRKRS